MSLRTLCLVSLVSLSLACQQQEEAPKVERTTAAWQELVAEGHFEKRQTLGSLGEPLATRLGLTSISTGRDLAGIHGLGEDLRFLVVEKLADDLTRKARIYKGTVLELEITLAPGEESIFSPRGATLAVWPQVMDESGKMVWKEGEPIKVYSPGHREGITVAKGVSRRVIAVGEDGTLLLEDGPGRYRKVGPEGKDSGQVVLPDVFPTEVEPYSPFCRYDFLPAQSLVVVRDYRGMSDAKGKRALSGLRLFSLKDGSLVGTFPNGISAAGGDNAPNRYVVTEKPGIMSFFENGKKTGQVNLPGMGELAISPDGSYIALTHPHDKLWLIKVDEHRVLWEHTSPPPWNRFIPEGTKVGNSGRTYGTRMEEVRNDYPRQLQLFTIDPAGNGLILMEREYQDASIPPLWLIGASDDADDVLLGAIGEQVRTFKLNKPAEPAPDPGDLPTPAGK